MASIAEFTIDADAFPLGELFDNLSNVTVELERVIPTNHAVIPYVWVSGTKIDGKKLAVGSDPAIEEIRIIDEVDGRYLVRIAWQPDYDGVLQAITETEAVLLSAFSKGERWTFEVRGDDHQAISSFQEVCREYDVPIKLTNLYALSRMETGTEYDLTETQHEALVLAYERGYFRSPREASLEDIAAELDITGQALGSRIRRGVNRLVGSTLVGV